MTTHRRTIRDAKSLGAALAQVRTQRNATQTETAAAVGLDRSQLAHLEAGRSGRFLANVLAVLTRLDARIVIEWSVPQDENGVSDLADLQRFVPPRETEEEGFHR